MNLSELNEQDGKEKSVIEAARLVIKNLPMASTIEFWVAVTNMGLALNALDNQPADLPPLMQVELEHVKGEKPDLLEISHEMYWCRRCGRALETFDGRELSGKAKPCRVVPVSLRSGES